LLFGFAAALLGRHLIDLSQIPAAVDMLRIAAVTFVVPALAEEVVFRGLVIRRFDWRHGVASVTLYVLWHPIEALFFLPAAHPVFFDPAFLLLVTLLGSMCTIVYCSLATKATGRLCLILHYSAIEVSIAKVCRRFKAKGVVIQQFYRVSATTVGPYMGEIHLTGRCIGTISC